MGGKCGLFCKGCNREVIYPTLALGAAVRLRYIAGGFTLDLRRVRPSISAYITTFCSKYNRYPAAQ
jgi:hypothetical protein